MDDINVILNQTFYRCMREFAAKCVPYCGDLYLHNVVSVCVNVSVRSTLERRKYSLDSSVNNQYDSDLAVPLYGYITPILAVITLVFNMLIVCLLSSKSMRSPTNLILVNIAVCDTVTILSPLAWYLHNYVGEGYKNFPLYSWCVVFRYFGFLIPTCFHNIAVWLTVMLSIHRYIGISHPNTARSLCTYRAVIKGHVCVFILITFLVSSQLIFEDMEKIQVLSKDMFDKEGLVYIETCYFKPSFNVFLDTYKMYFRVYPCVRVVVCNITPCTLLIVFNTLLIRKTYQSYAYRKKLLNGSKKWTYLEIAEIVKTTIMLLSVCLLTLLVEIPNGVLFTLHVAKEVWEISLSNINKWLTFPNFILFVTYPTYFIIYFTMNRRFRRRLLRFCCKRMERRGIYTISKSADV